MFVLLKRVRAWRAEMQARGVFSPGELVELEDHLLEEAGRLAEEGRDDDDAFIEALRRMGTGEELTGQFRLAHELSGAPVGAWTGRAVTWGLLLCRWLRGLVVFCLPGLAMALPGLIGAGMVRRGGFLPEYAVYGDMRPVPAATALAWEGVQIASSNWWWLLPLLVVLMVAPTVHRIRHLRDGTDASVVAIVADELSAARPLVLAGVLAYPLVASGLVQAAFGPLFRLVSVVGG